MKFRIKDEKGNTRIIDINFGQKTFRALIRITSNKYSFVNVLARDSREAADKAKEFGEVINVREVISENPGV